MNDAYRGPDTEGEPRDDDQGLFADLGHFETGAIPVDATVRQGRAIRTRRRVIGSGMLAIAAALSIGVPAAIAGGGGSGARATSVGRDGLYGASSTGGRVAVNPTPFTAGKGHFSGAVDGKKWSVDFDNKHCVDIMFACGFQDLLPWGKYATLAGDGSWGVDGQPDNYALFVKKDVARATITLQDGEVLRFEPVPVVDVPVALFALPHGVGISKIELFDVHGAEIAYSLPFNLQGTVLTTPAHWYKPAEKPPTASGSVRLLRGDTGLDGQETLTAFTGPSGPCIVTQTKYEVEAACGELRVLNGSLNVETPIVTEKDGTKHPYQGGTSMGLVAPAVARAQLDFSDGTTSPLPLTSLDGYRFYAYITPLGKVLTGFTAFDAAGKALPVQTNTQYNAG